MSKNRIYTLDVFKLLLAWQIALGHIRIHVPPSSAVSVDIFFIISGFFLAHKFYASTYGKGESGLTAWDYTLGHVKTIYPHFLFSLLMFLGYVLARKLILWAMSPSLSGLYDMGASIYDEISVALLLHSSHYFVDSLLYPTWQISALLIAGYFVYELLRQNEGTTRRLVLPAAVILVQSLMASGVDYFDHFGFFYLPLLRAFSSLGLGVLTYYFSTTDACTKLREHRTALNIASLLGILGILLYEGRGRTYLVLFPLILLVCLDPGCWLNRVLNKKVFSLCGKLSLAVYLNQTFIINFCENQILPRFSLPTPAIGILLVVLLTVYSLCTVKIVDWIVARRKIGGKQ